MVTRKSAALTKTELLVLTAIAYLQPVTRAGVSDLLGREASRDIIAALRDDRLISSGPRSPSPGRLTPMSQRLSFWRASASTICRICPGSSGSKRPGSCAKPSSTEPSKTRRAKLGEMRQGASMTSFRMRMSIISFTASKKTSSSK